MTLKSKHHIIINWLICSSGYNIYRYITYLVCYTYFHWFFNPECQHIFGKQTGYIFQSPKTNSLESCWFCDIYSLESCWFCDTYSLESCWFCGTNSLESCWFCDTYSLESCWFCDTRINMTLKNKYRRINMTLKSKYDNQHDSKV
jgi:hypothetical protein